MHKSIGSLYWAFLLGVAGVVLFAACENNTVSPGEEATAASARTGISVDSTATDSTCRGGDKKRRHYDADSTRTDSSGHWHHQRDSTRIDSAGHHPPHNPADSSGHNRHRGH